MTAGVMVNHPYGCEETLKCSDAHEMPLLVGPNRLFLFQLS